MQSNRRQHERIRAPKIQVRVASLERLRALYLEDLSQGGIFIRTEKTLPVGAAVEVELVPPEMPPLPLKGTVVRAVTDDASKREKRAGMGIKFEDLTEEAQAALAVLISRLREPAPAAPAPRAPEPSSGSADGEPTVASLQMELADLKGKLEAYEHQQRQLELDEETSRRLAERLAQEKADAGGRAEKASHELERMRGDLAAASSLKGELRAAEQERDDARRRIAELEEELDAVQAAQATTEAALDAERREHENTFGELSALQKKGGASEEQTQALKAELKDVKAALARAQAGLEEERAKAETARSREREVRRLLSLVSGAAPDEGAPARLPEPAPPAAARAPEPVPELPPELEIESDLASPEPAPPLPEESPAAPPRAEAAGDGVPDFDVAFEETPLEHDNLPSPKGEGAARRAQELLAFAERLRKAGRIVRTERYHSHTPTDPAEIFVFDLLTRVQTLEDLAKWTQGRLTREKLVQIVFEFSSRSLISLD